MERLYIFGRVRYIFCNNPGIYFLLSHTGNKFFCPGVDYERCDGINTQVGWAFKFFTGKRNHN
ncbi:hypothetical protein [Iningainema tapete]|uniref:Uncharacterized protein n=1 Tax=Iningainema tapete BLCC-T55 TaxID=2748662 RepID=A0A8J6XL28_9CYAN|nr:hypothetical protein [Iningainema tapete]MBD2775002.1 hypothetical protein [Iningainema tapete BLCC-T55]